jgi:Ca-activated chloride channel family protein
MEGFQFHSPLWFLLAPAVVAAIWWAWRQHRQPAAVFSTVADLKGLPVTLAQRVRRVLPFVYGAGLLLLVASLARPQAGRTESRVNTEGIAIEMIVDMSGSMQALDFELNGKRDSRVNAVKHVFKQFVAGGDGGPLRGRRSDLVGLVAFGGFADSKCPLTLDHNSLLEILQDVNVPKPIRDRRGRIINERMYREEQMTAVGDGLALGLDNLRRSDAKSKVAILLSDGESNAGVVDPLEAAKAAQKLGIKVYTIGIGQTGVAPIPMEDEFGQRVLVPQQVRIDEDMLREIAGTTGGQYFNAKDTKALVEVYAAIDSMERSKVEETRFTEYTELYLWLAVPGLALVLIVGFLGQTRFRALP